MRVIEDVVEFNMKVVQVEIIVTAMLVVPL